MTPETVDRVCFCGLREQIREDDGTCWRCGGRISESLEEIKRQYRDPSRADS